MEGERLWVSDKQGSAVHIKFCKHVFPNWAQALGFIVP